MVKKVIALAGAGAILLSLAAPVFAFHHHWWGSKDIAIIKDNDVTAVASTGYNSQDVTAKAQKGGDVNASGTRSITTGDAYAKAKGVIVANTHVKCDGCYKPKHEDVAVVEDNNVVAMADTGMNYQDVMAKAQKGGDVNASGTRVISTGGAWAKAKGYIIINTHLSL